MILKRGGNVDEPTASILLKLIRNPLIKSHYTTSEGLEYTTHHGHHHSLHHHRRRRPRHRSAITTPPPQHPKKSETNTHLGRATALKFAKTYPVVLLARNADNYTTIVKEIEDSGGRAIGITADATNPTSLASAFDTIEKELPGASIAAAIYNVSGGLARKPFLEVGIEELDDSLNASPYVSPFLSPLSGLG